ncbi:Tgtp1 [Symbiodinium natans]|uniref:Tgtp1 protein n=1 Tax=Symbiodinium natans TaxID=878477 RepID=A0A812RSU7_9DINO|nr:Tgtp1 [Symbiodinium natans]
MGKTGSARASRSDGFTSCLCGLARSWTRSGRRAQAEAAEGAIGIFKQDGFSADDWEEEVDNLVKDLCAAPPIRICFIGKRGVGKSTLVNSLRSLKPSDAEAATVGADETTTEDTTYSFLGMRLHDLPGCEGSIETATMGKDYINKYKLHEADACIFVYTTVLEPRMLECARMLQCDHKVPTFLVRNKVGTACKDEVEDGNASDLSEAFQSIRDTALRQISLAGNTYSIFEEESRLFLVEARYGSAVRQDPKELYQKEFHRLKDALQMQIRDEAKRAQTQAIFQKNAKVLARLRAAACMEIVGGHCIAGAFSSELPGLIYVHRRRLVKVFMKQFGLTKEYLTRLKNTTMMEAALGRQFFVKETLDQIVPNVAGPAVQAVMMYRFCERAIKQLEPIAAKYYEMEFELSYDRSA